MPDLKLPYAIILPDGTTVPVIWSSLGTGFDEFGQPVEYYFPSPTLENLSPSIAVNLLYNIHQVNLRTFETELIDETVIPSLGIDWNELYKRASYVSVAEKLLEQGSLTEEQLGESDIQGYLAIQSRLVGQRGKGTGWMAKFQQMSVDVERITSDPAFADYMRRMGAFGELTPEMQRATAESDATTAFNLAEQVRAAPEGALAGRGTEKEWLQNMVQRLEPYYRQYKDKEMYAGETMQYILPSLMETYETSQARLAEISGGAPEAAEFDFLPSQGGIMTPQFGWNPITAGLESPPGTPTRDPFLTPLPKGKEILSEWDRLIAESRPERIARL